MLQSNPEIALQVSNLCWQFVSHAAKENATELVSIQEGLYLCVHAKLQGVILWGAPDQIFQETEGGNIEIG